MANYTVLISHGEDTVDITNLVDQVAWKGRKGSAARSVTVRLLDDDGYKHARVGIDVEQGYHCMFLVDGKERFQGIIMKSTQKKNKTMSFTAYDNGIYLSNNKDTFVYTNKTAGQIYVDVCNRLGLPVGSVASTYYKIPELTKKKTTAWDVIADAMSLEYEATGVRHYVTSSKNRLSLITRRDTIVQWLLEVDHNIIDYTYERSIEDVRTRLRLFSDEGAVLAEYTNPTLESKIGVMQDVDTVDETLTKAQLHELCRSIMKQINTPARKLKLNVLGLPDVISGIGVVVRIPHLDISRTFYVDQDTHTFKGNKHTMSLTLTCATDIGTGSSGGGGGGTQGTSTSIKGMFQGALAIDNELLQGDVIAVSPLKIRMVGDTKLIISEAVTVVPKHLTNYTVTCTMNGSTGTMNFNNALRVGDRVHLLSLQSGKKYYVLDRV